MAVFEPFGNLYGSERSMLDLLGVLPVDVVRPVVYCPKEAPWLAELRNRDISYSDSFELGLHECSRARRMGALMKFVRFLLKERIELIHVNQAGAAPYALAAAVLLRLPVVLHSRWHEDAKAINSWRLGHDRLSAIVCISEFQKKLLLDELKIHREKVVVVRNPYALRPKPCGCSGAASKQATFVCPARFHPHKRQDLLVRASAHYAKQYGCCRVEFIGEEVQGAGYLAALKAAVSELGLERKVAFLGYRHHVVACLDNATAMVLPSDFEALGRVIFEAWEAGTVPVAWSGSGGPAEIIEAADGGILYGRQTPEALAAAMHEAVRLSASARAAMTTRGLRWLGQNCAPEDHARKILSIWQEALRQHKHGRPF